MSKYKLLNEEDVMLKLDLELPEDSEVSDIIKGVELVGEEPAEAEAPEGDEGEPADDEADLEAELAELLGLSETDDDVDEVQPQPSPMSEEDDDAKEFYEFFEGDDVDEDDDADEVVEIDENMLRQELMRMKHLLEGDGTADFGGGKKTAKDAYGVKINANDPDLKGKGAMKESRRNRALKKVVLQYRQAVNELKSQLTEMNLFNAKLIYANKLLQNENLSRNQKLNVVKSLDKARSLREVKLLFRSLTESISGSDKSLTESSRRKVFGSASRPVTSGNPTNLNEGSGDVDRWAVLAGIK